MTEEILMEIKPTYKGIERLLSKNLLKAFVWAWVFAWLFMIPLFFNESFQDPLVCFIAWTIITLASFLIMSLVFVWLDERNFKATTYRVYSNRVEFEEGFINHKYTVINMQDIREIHLTQNFVQRWVGLGTIRFITAANVSSERQESGIGMRCIQNSKDIYTQIKQIHETKK